VGFMIQSESVHRSHGTLLAPLLFLTVVTLGGGLFVAFVGRVLPWARGVVRSRRARWRQQHDTAQIEMRARALMDELSPHGWRAQLTLFPAPPHDRPSESSESSPRSGGARLDRLRARRLGGADREACVGAHHRAGTRGHGRRSSHGRNARPDRAGRARRRRRLAGFVAAAGQPRRSPPVNPGTRCRGIRSRCSGCRRS
jgi:hypothetical protein